MQPPQEVVAEETQSIPTQQMSEEDVPSAQSIIQAMKEKFAETSKESKSGVVTSIPQTSVSAESLIEEEKRIAEGKKARKEASKDKSVEEAEKLYEQLKKKGTLRKE